MKLSKKRQALLDDVAAYMSWSGADVIVENRKYVLCYVAPDGDFYTTAPDAAGAFWARLEGMQAAAIVAREGRKIGGAADPVDVIDEANKLARDSNAADIRGAAEDFARDVFTFDQLRNIFLDEFEQWEQEISDNVLEDHKGIFDDETGESVLREAAAVAFGDNSRIADLRHQLESAGIFGASKLQVSEF